MSCSDVDEDQELDEFQDASDTSVETIITLEKAIEDAYLAINYFFNNDFNEAKKLIEPWCNVSMYHALDNSIFTFLEGILTLEHERIVSAMKTLKLTVIACNKLRKRNTIGESLGKMVKKNYYDQYTDEEAHAELCYAECLLLNALLILVEDETLTSFIKAGIRVRSCYNTYKHCQLILKYKNWENNTTKVHFESGVLMGIGIFNLMISMFPSRVIRLLEFIGFSGNKDLGLYDLTRGANMGGMRQALCVITLAAYHSMVLPIWSHGDGDLNICEEILQDQLTKHPNGAWFLFFKGRLEFMKCNLNDALEWYKKSWKSQVIWTQFHQTCFWELLWINCVKTDWNEALIYATYLIDGSRWSKSIDSYQKVAIMLMMETYDKAVIDNLLCDVRKYKRRVGGKSLPMEKFVLKKAERYYNQNDSLVLPVIELMYLWNMFKILKGHFETAEKIFAIIERAAKDIITEPTDNKYHNDNIALVFLLKGACLKQMGSPLQALECLEFAISLKKKICEDHYIVPFAIVELALIEWDRGNKHKAVLALEDAKKNYSKYSLESRLHFIIHTALADYKRNQV